MPRSGPLVAEPACEIGRSCRISDFWTGYKQGATLAAAMTHLSLSMDVENNRD